MIHKGGSSPEKIWFGSTEVYRQSLPFLGTNLLHLPLSSPPCSQSIPQVALLGAPRGGSSPGVSLDLTVLAKTGKTAAGMVRGEMGYGGGEADWEREEWGRGGCGRGVDSTAIVGSYSPFMQYSCPFPSSDFCHLKASIGKRRPIAFTSYFPSEAFRSPFLIQCAPFWRGVERRIELASQVRTFTSCICIPLLGFCSTDICQLKMHSGRNSNLESGWHS